MHVMAQMVCSNATALYMYVLNACTTGGETLIKLILHLPSPVFPGTGTERNMDSKHQIMRLQASITDAI